MGREEGCCCSRTSLGPSLRLIRSVPRPSLLRACPSILLKSSRTESFTVDRLRDGDFGHVGPSFREEADEAVRARGGTGTVRDDGRAYRSTASPNRDSGGDAMTSGWSRRSRQTSLGFAMVFQGSRVPRRGHFLRRFGRGPPLGVVSVQGDRAVESKSVNGGRSGTTGSFQAAAVSHRCVRVIRGTA